MSTVGDIMNTVGGYLEYRGGVQYRGGSLFQVESNKNSVKERHLLSLKQLGSKSYFPSYFITESCVHCKVCSKLSFMIMSNVCYHIIIYLNYN